MLTAPNKTKEKPSIVSKKVLKTHHKNGTESYLLTEKIKTLEHKQSQKTIDIDMEVNSLKKKMEAVQRVKEKISLSKERRMLLKSQGYTIRVCKGDKEDEIFLRRDQDSLQVDAGNWATLLANPPDLSSQSDFLEPQDADESPDDSSTASENRPNVRMRSFSFSSAVDSRPTQISRYRVIEPPLRPGSRRGFTTLSTAPSIPKTDQETRQELNEDFASERAPSRWDTVRNRPMSGRSQFVEAVIAARDGNYFTNTQHMTRERMKNYRRRKLKAGSSRRTMSAPVIKMRPAMERTIDKREDPRQSDKKEVYCTSDAESDSNQKNSAKLKVDKVDSLIEGEKEISKGIRPTSEGNPINDSTLDELNRDQQDGLCLSGTSSGLSNLEKKICFTQDNNGVSAAEKGAKDTQAEGKEESSDISRNISLMKCNQKPNQRSKNANKCNEFFPMQTSKMSNVDVDADVLNPVRLNGQEAGPSEDADESESCVKNKLEECACAVDSDTAIQEASGKTYLSVPDNTVTSRMSIRRHSSDDCEIKNVKFHSNLDRNQYSRKDSLAKGHVTLQVPQSSLLSRRMSHPPRLASFQRDDKLRGRKALKNEDEVVYAYDARPDKSLAKGYRAMQMTVGGRQVKINMPAFPKESGTIMADRAKLNSKFSSFKGKIKESQ